MASEYLKWKYRDVRPDEPIVLTRGQKLANWWHYHRWALLVGALVLIAAADIAVSALGFGKARPDYQVACVTSAPLGDDATDALRRAIADLGEDCNGDGRVVVQINSYVDMSAAQESDAARYAAAARVRLLADLESCESYFFICEAPESIQSDYQILARADGGLAEEGQRAEWIPCRAVASLAEALPKGQALYLARRGFWEDRTCQYREQCDALWNALTEG